MRRFGVSLATTALAAAGLTVLLASSAHALILDNKTPEQKFRLDVGKQSVKYLACVIKAGQTCEKSGAVAGQECNLVTETATSPADPKGKLGPALTKCASKVNFSKKAGTLTYEDIGCPGDCDTSTAGPQRCANLQAYQDFTVGDSGTRATINAEGGVIPTLTGCADNAACVAESVRYSKYALGVLKCMGACEADYSNKKGNGGPTDAGVCHLPVTSPADPGGTDPVFLACVSKAKAGAEKKGGPLNATLTNVLNGALNSAVDDLSNIPGGNCGP